MATILVVDDDPVLAHGVQRGLEVAGYSVLVAFDGETALRTARELRLSLIILDLLMPHMDGMEVIHWLRADPVLRAIPILLLTPQGWQPEEGGSSIIPEAVAKPFALDELVARVEALISLETSVYRSEPSSLWQVGPLTVDPRNFSLRGQQGMVRLTPTEFGLLRCLVERSGEVVSVSELLAAVWGYANQEGGPELVRAHVRNLRGKIQRVAGHAGQILQTVPRYGYTLASEIRD